MPKKSPTYLYHYTSINNLALILNSQRIRFTRADLVNDLDEINVKDVKRWLKKASSIQWDYKNIVKRKGKLERLK